MKKKIKNILLLGLILTISSLTMATASATDVYNNMTNAQIQCAI